MPPYRVIHLCVPTYQNTINAYSHQFLDALYLQTGICDKREICHVLIESKGAKKLEWSTKLRDMYSNAYEYTNLKIFPIDETETLESKLKSLIEFIDDNKLIDSDTELVINYGGGLKQFTLMLMAIMNNYDENLSYLLYPDKGINKLIETIFKNQKFQDEIQTELIIQAESTDILKLYLGKNVVCSKTILYHNDLSQVDQNLATEISRLPDMYADPFTSALIFQTASTSDPEPYEDLSVEMFFSIFDSYTKNAAQKAMRKSYTWYRDAVVRNIIAEYNSSHGRSVDFNLEPDMKLRYNSPDKKVSTGLITNLIDQFRKILWSKKHYKNVLNEINIDSNGAKALDKLGLKLPAKNQNGNYDKINLVKNLFSNYSFPKPIDGHGLYFEYYIANLIIEKAKLHPEVIKEVAFDISLNQGTQSQLQIDAMIYTANGSLYFIECKTFKYSRMNFVSSLHRVQALGGVFTQYIIVLPQLPSERHPDLYNKFNTIYKDYKDMTAGYRSVTCCQCANSQSEGELDLVVFEDILNKIVAKG